MINPDYYWRLGVYVSLFHIVKIDRNKLKSLCLELRLKSDTYLDKKPLRIINLELCARKSEGFCREVPVLRAQDPYKGPFRIECSGCNLSTGYHDTIEELAKAWNQIALVRKVIEDL